MKSFIVGIICGVLLLSCASAAISYNYYGLAADSYDGKLLGVDESKDLPLSICEPDAKVKGKCVVMLKAEFFKMKSDLDQTREKLISCERGE